MKYELYQPEILDQGMPKAHIDAVTKAMLNADVQEAVEMGLYRHVANVHATGLVSAFWVGNTGPNESIERLDRMMSISVGHILVDEDRKAHVVASYGFEPVPGFPPADVSEAGPERMKL
ncbi:MULTISPECIES: hypothetical protein [unclassified Thioalkalivibrio]|uniref:hypothetical protein n=1 Tax=unclassified Thioalkalivibrio TaxID=2621013 RepID=UPI00036874F6|nr:MULTISPECIES: hypothetical protein [unclassified Thioalkalivibrio]